MEDITKILPFLPVTKVDKPSKKKTKQILDERPRLVRTNRPVLCAYCKTERILNPDQYQSYFDFYGSEDKIAQEFMCKPCDMFAKENPVLFWLTYSSLLSDLCKDIKIVFDVYIRSPKIRGVDDIILQAGMTDVLSKRKIGDGNTFEFLIENGLPSGLKLKSVPFAGNITIKPYDTTTKIKIGD